MLKSESLVRIVDQLGRVVLPSGLRCMIGINGGDALEIYLENGKIILKKYLPRCMFCDNAEGLKKIMGKNVCISCLEEIKRLSD